MAARARQFFLALLVACVPALAGAQALWQPSAPPLVTAENEPWFRAGDAIIWSGDYYYPSGAVRHFNPYQMVRSGSYQGIPLYTDATLDPYGIVFVPLPGGLMQPYERRRDGALAGTTGNTNPTIPTVTAVEGMTVENTAILPQIYQPRQAAGAFSMERPYDVAPLPTAAAVPAPSAVATAGREAAPALAEPAGPVETAEQPQGINAVWVTFDGRRWFADGPALDLQGRDFTRIGTYHGFAVYRWNQDATKIYIPTASGVVAPYSLTKPKLHRPKW